MTEPITLTIAPTPSGQLAHRLGTYAWHAPHVYRHSWVWPLMALAGITRARLTHCMAPNVVDIVAGLDMLMAANLRPLICLDSPNGEDQGDLEHWRDRVAMRLATLYSKYGPNTPRRLEYWNEPDSYWRLDLQPDTTARTSSWLAMCRETAAGVADAENATGYQWHLGGPSLGRKYGAWQVGYHGAVRDGLRHDYSAVHWYASDGEDMPASWGTASTARITEFNLDGAGRDPRLDTNEGATWLLDTLSRADPRLRWYISGAWGQLENYPGGNGKLGLCIVGDGLYRTRPQYNALCLWAQLGAQRYAVAGVPDDLAGVVGAVVDERGALLIWNNGPDEVFVRLPHRYARDSWLTYTLMPTIGPLPIGAYNAVLLEGPIYVA